MLKYLAPVWQSSACWDACSERVRSFSVFLLGLPARLLCFQHLGLPALSSACSLPPRSNALSLATIEKAAQHVNLTQPWRGGGPCWPHNPAVRPGPGEMGEGSQSCAGGPALHHKHISPTNEFLGKHQPFYKTELCCVSSPQVVMRPVGIAVGMSQFAAVSIGYIQAPSARNLLLRVAACTCSGSRSARSHFTAEMNSKEAEKKNVSGYFNVVFGCRVAGRWILGFQKFL